MCPKTNRLASNGILVYQPPNSVLVMAGEFQKQLYHGVLSWTQMNKLFLQQEITEFMDSIFVSKKQLFGEHLLNSLSHRDFSPQVVGGRVPQTNRG